jgi:hypothetical protein
VVRRSRIAWLASRAGGGTRGGGKWGLDVLDAGDRPGVLESGNPRPIPRNSARNCEGDKGLGPPIPGTTLEINVNGSTLTQFADQSDRVRDRDQSGRRLYSDASAPGNSAHLTRRSPRQSPVPSAPLDEVR